MTAGWDEPHNGTDLWQGAFRVGWLDLAAHRYAATVCGGIDQVVVTHLDRGGPIWRYSSRYDTMDKIPLGRRGDLGFQEGLTNRLRTAQSVPLETTESKLLEAIETHLGAPVGITSRGPTAAAKRQHILEATNA